MQKSGDTSRVITPRRAPSLRDSRTDFQHRAPSCSEKRKATARVEMT